MADYFGNLPIERHTLKHWSAFFKLAVEQIRNAQQQNDIQDMIVVVEAPGLLPSSQRRVHRRRAFAVGVVDGQERANDSHERLPILAVSCHQTDHENDFSRAT